MSAFGFDYYTRNFGEAIKAAGAARLSNRILAALEMLVGELHGLGSGAGSAPLDTVFSFIYPFVGGNATAHSFNLANPNTAKIAWGGGGTITHNANGITGDGVSYGDTGFALAIGTISAAFGTVGVYSRTNVQIAGYDMSNQGSVSIDLACRWSDGKGYFDHCANATGPVAANVTVTVADSRGLFTLRRAGTADFNAYRNGVSLGSDTGTTVNSYTTTNFLLLSFDGGTSFSTRNLAFAFLGNSTTLNTTSKQAPLYTIIQNFETRLNRQV